MEDISGDDEEEHKEGEKKKAVYKNYLTKSLIDQVKGMCFENSTVYRNFESMFAKIMIRFQQSIIFDDDEIS